MHWGFIKRYLEKFLPHETQATEAFECEEEQPCWFEHKLVDVGGI